MKFYAKETEPYSPVVEFNSSEKRNTWLKYGDWFSVNVGIETNEYSEIIRRIALSHDEVKGLLEGEEIIRIPDLLEPGMVYLVTTFTKKWFIGLS